MNKVISSIGAGTKRLVSFMFGTTTARWFAWPSRSFDYAREVGDGTGSSTVMAPLLWIARTFPEAPPSLWSHDEDGQETMIREHPMLELLARPNQFYTGPILWMATMIDWSVDGNAYWYKLRDQTGVVRQLWWIPHWMMEPASNDDKTFITHYQYTAGGKQSDLAIDDIVHFRFGLDSQNPRKGYSPLKSVLSEVFTDDEAARFTASLLKNMGVPGLVVSPGTGVTITEEAAKDVKKDVAEKFTGDRRGEPIVMTGPTEIHQFGFSPEQLVLKDLRRIPEERVTAVLGVPAIVAGLGAGLERSTFTNMGEAREAAYESGIIPTQRIIAEDVRFQLLNEFETPRSVHQLRFGFDLSKVRVLAEDEDKLLRRVDVGYRGGFIRRSEARRAVGLPIGDQDEVYLVPANSVEVNVSDGVIRPMATNQQLQLPVANGNGNGNSALVSA